jgi:hypothetical protein
MWRPSPIRRWWGSKPTSDRTAMTGNEMADSIEAALIGIVGLWVLIQVTTILF